MPQSPFAKYAGELKLGNAIVDCYVLDIEERVISFRATVKALAGTESGDLSSYIDVKPLKKFINSGEIMSATIDFFLPGSIATAKGITAENFLEICRAYVMALNENVLETERQKEIAIKCSILLSACAKVGLIALIDEATGYQYDRAENALQLKLKLFIAEEIREWEKTFPDELWEEFGRLDNWSTPLHNRPKWWGKLVMTLIYEALDKDIADYLRNNKPTPVHGKNYHQWLTENYGLKNLIAHINQIIGVAKTCKTINELKEQVAYLYKHQPLQQKLWDKMQQL